LPDIGPHREEPIGTIKTINGTSYQCFDAPEWAKMGELVLHYHSIYPLVEQYKQQEFLLELRIDNLVRYKNELITSQNDSMLHARSLQSDIEKERAKSKVLLWLTSIAGGAAIVLGGVLIGVAR